jgi:hypothetical protein
MTLADLFVAVCDLLQRRTGAQVILGLPGESDSGVFVWPWRLAQNPNVRNAPQHNGRPDGPGQAKTSYRDVYFLIVVRPALTPAGLALLDAAQCAIAQEPALCIGEESVQLLLDTPATNDLAQVFLAAHIPLSICLSVVVRGVPVPDAPTAQAPHI